jgi:hypothetical protein
VPWAAAVRGLDAARPAASSPALPTPSSRSRRELKESSFIAMPPIIDD